ncbi:argininosuccinate lyase [Streptomyces sp. NL15-2K]|uniref:argininosuccinate lyase n=1 Tax=Streptomyces sp. NL15-2K TaxID=376149 RepID=UPI000F569078|nr:MULTISPECIES: argininosuccinate lyase [Actinomycetes]WKX09953.1 argininosuccinate lyase [Kutzneria buriramensis]GCB48498.1 argininosuccinate lyase [Streptomyces sp. NL15-2K]
MSTDERSLAARRMDAIGTSAHYDRRLAPYDIAASQAHVTMLHKQGIVPADAAAELHRGLDLLKERIETGADPLDPTAEDVHTAIEQYLETQIGADAGWLGTARARNDLAVTALRLWIRDQVGALTGKVLALTEALAAQAEQHSATVMPGFSHLQIAQPVTFGHVCLAYAETFLRDAERLRFVLALQDESPMGSAALAGTGFPIDRESVARSLGFDRPTANSLESVGDRGFALDFLAAGTSLALDLSRFGAEIVFWSSQPIGLVSLPDELVSSSAALPHKRNPDAAELIRGKSGRVLGNLHTLQTVVKGLPLSYFRDLQEDKEPLFDTADTLVLVLDAAISIATLTRPNVDAMRAASDLSFVTSGDLADWLTRERKIPFREAHHLVTKLVRLAEEHRLSLGELSLELRGGVDERLAFSEWPDITVDASVASRDSQGGTAPSRVLEAAAQLRSKLAEFTARAADR